MLKQRPPDSFNVLMQIAQEQQGYFTTKQALESGYADNTHPYHVRMGNWERIQRGIYRLAHLAPAEDGLTPAYLLWTRGRDGEPAGVLSHETALSYRELGDFNPAKVHITVPVKFRRNRPTPKAVILYRDTLAPSEITLLRGMRIAGGRHPAELGSESAARDESGRGTSGHCREWVVRCKTEAFFGNWPQKSAKNPARPPKLKMGKPGPFNWGGDSLSPQSPPTASASWKPEPRRPAISVES